MYRFSTKTNLELENEEAERLVRESPKVKPPRYDRRREEVESERDPDVEGDPDLKGDPDLSLNYKTIGGSERVLGRWIKAKAESKSKKVKVRKKDTDWVGEVSKETVKKSPSKYEVVKEKEEPSEKEPAKEEKPVESKPSKDEGERASDAEASQTLRDMAKEDPEFASILKDFTNPKSDMFQWAKASPETSIPEQFMHGRALPKGVKTMGDLQRVLLYKAPAKKAPKAPGTKGEPVEGQPKGPKSKAPTKKAPKAPEKAPGSPDRPYSRDELLAAHNQLIHTFPAKIAAKLMMTYPPIHPDEITTIISEYNKAKHISTELKDVPKLRDSISAVYATDPNQVPPPKADKNGKPFEDLPEEEKARVHRQYQIETLAMSIAAREAVAKSFEKEASIPEDLSDNLADFVLSGHKEDPENRMKRASEKAEELFYEGIKAAPKKPFSDETIEKVLGAVGKDPAAQKIITGYFQAQDYQNARERFLNPKSREAISEYQSPDKIAARLSKAVEFLRKQTNRYPEDVVVQDTAMTFRNRVMQHLGSLAPEKQSQIQENLDEDDNHYYDEQIAKHKKKLAKFKRKYRKEIHTAVAGFRKECFKKELPEEEPPKEEPKKRLKKKEVINALEQLKSQGIIEPPEPLKPPRYDSQRKKPKELKESAKSLWRFFKRRTASESFRGLVRERMASQGFFIYPESYYMTNKNAVYLGIEPKKVAPYTGWSQPQARDLTDKDFSRVLIAARKWLETPVLSTSIEGVVRDTQLRAALDLALRTENYDHAMHPTLYNDLLSRLAGEPRDETLVTVRNAQIKGRSTMSDKVELNINQVDQILARLDRMAATVQENHEKWGLKFAAAKDLVNEIDKTADELEMAAYGEKSFTVRQAQIFGKTAEVIQKDADESYMETFKNTMAPIQTEADEKYMSAYGDDQSSAVNHGKSSTGRPLAP